MFKRNNKKPSVICTSSTLSNLIREHEIDCISVHKEVCFSAKRKEYQVVEIELLDDNAATGQLDLYSIENAIRYEIKLSSSIFILSISPLNNGLGEVSLIGLLFKVSILIENCKLKIRLFINK